MKKLLFLTGVFGLMLSVNSLFAEDKKASSSSSNSGSGKDEAAAEEKQTAHGKALEGVSFTLPAGAWWDVPKKYSLAPDIMNKVQEKLETKKKISVIFSSTSPVESVREILESSENTLTAQWDDISVIEAPKLISDRLDVGSGMQFRTIYSLRDIKTGVYFKLFVYVATAWEQKGNRGILYIFVPASGYYKNRQFIAQIKDALKVAPIKDGTPLPPAN